LPRGGRRALDRFSHKGTSAYGATLPRWNVEARRAEFVAPRSFPILLPAASERTLSDP